MSSLTGTFEVGDLVWRQMYSPTHPHWFATLEERIAGGVRYRGRELLRIVWVGPAEQGPHPLSGKELPPATTRWVFAKPGHEANRDHYSSCDDNWCVLEHATTDDALF
ncbi:hypothetical protein [Agromyces bauzanensis]